MLSHSNYQTNFICFASIEDLINRLQIWEVVCDPKRDSNNVLLIEYVTFPIFPCNSIPTLYPILL